jgi:outer membrane immunogenic protein
MKLYLPLSVVLSVIVAAEGAWGADPSFKAPTTAVPAFNWSGLYIGIEGGGGMVASSGGYTESGQGVGGIAGGQVGYNYQINGFVFGLEFEGLLSEIKSRHHLINPNPGILSYSSSDTNNSFYDVAARIGWTFFERTLIYGKLGVVWSDQSYTYASNFPSSVKSDWGALGVLIGGGFEYVITNNWTARFEADLLLFDPTDVTLSGNGQFAGTTSTVNDVGIVGKMGISYKF